MICPTCGTENDADATWLGVIEEFQDLSSLPLAIRADLWDRDASAARQDLERYDAGGVHGPAADADRTTMHAGLAALEGRTAEALTLYRDGLRAWQELGLAWDEAQCGMDMALLLDVSEPEVRAAAESAREILVRLGARPFIERLDAALAATAGDGEARVETAPVESAAGPA